MAPHPMVFAHDTQPRRPPEASNLPRLRPAQSHSSSCARLAHVITDTRRNSLERVIITLHQSPQYEQQPVRSGSTHSRAALLVQTLTRVVLKALITHLKILTQTTTIILSRGRTNHSTCRPISRRTTRHIHRRHRVRWWCRVTRHRGRWRCHRWARSGRTARLGLDGVGPWSRSCVGIHGAHVGGRRRWRRSHRIHCGHCTGSTSSAGVDVDGATSPSTITQNKHPKQVCFSCYDSIQDRCLPVHRRSITELSFWLRIMGPNRQSPARWTSLTP